MAEPSTPADLTPAILAQVKPSILSILRSSDLQQVSAKKVRIQLDDDGLLTRLGVDLTYKPHKSALDEEIRSAFALVDAEVKDREAKQSNAAPAAASYGNGSSSSSSAAATPVDRKPAIGIALPGGGVRGDSSASDAAMAAALQKQFNADSAPTRATRGAAASTPRKGKAGSSKKRKLKGEDTISSDEEDGSILDSGTPKKKKPSKKKKKSADGEAKAKNPNNPFNKPNVLSPLMAEICGGDEMPRYEVTKKLWAYIKSNQLQDPSNGRVILCDDKLKALFGKEKVDSFAMAKLMSAHLKKKEDVSNP